MLEGTSAKPRQLPRIDRIAYVMWGIFGAALALRIALRTNDYNGVYGGYYKATLCWLEGRPVYGANPEFVYPPFALVLLSLFAPLGEHAGGVAWRVFTFCTYFGAIFWALRVGFPRPLGRRARGVFWLLLIVPSIGSLNIGQVNPVLFASILASAVAASLGRWRLAAVFGAPGVGLKLYPAAFGLLLGAMEPRRFLPWFALALGVVFALPYAFGDVAYVHALHREFVERLTGDERLANPNFRDFRLVLQLFGISVGAVGYLVIQGVAALGLLAASLRVRSLGYMVAFACCWMTLFGLATEKVTYILVAPVFCWCLVESRGRREFKLLLGAFLLFCFPQVPLGSLLRSSFAMVALPLATTVLLAVLLVNALRGANSR